MATSSANPWTDLRQAVQDRIEATLPNCPAYPWNGESDQAVLAVARKHGRAVWVGVWRVEAEEPAPRLQDSVQIEVSLTVVVSTQAPRNTARAGQGTTAAEQSEQLCWDLRQQFRDCFLAPWLSGRGLEYIRQDVQVQDPTATAVILRFQTWANVITFAGEVSPVSPLPPRITGQYSADGETWLDDYFDGATAARYSLDYGKTYGPAVRIKGEPGPAGDLRGIVVGGGDPYTVYSPDIPSLGGGDPYTEYN